MCASLQIENLQASFEAMTQSAPMMRDRYGTSDVNRLRLLRRIRLLGVPFSVRKLLLVGASDARCAEVQHELLALVETRVHAIDQEIDELYGIRLDSC